jgi:hypothetical protein
VEKAAQGDEPNPIVVACAHAGYEAVRANNRFMGRKNATSDKPFDKLTKKQRDPHIAIAWDAMSGLSAEMLYYRYDGSEGSWENADPITQLEYMLFIQACVTQMKVCLAIAKGAKKAAEDAETAEDANE